MEHSRSMSQVIFELRENLHRSQRSLRHTSSEQPDLVVANCDAVQADSRQIHEQMRRVASSRVISRLLHMCAEILILCCWHAWRTLVVTRHWFQRYENHLVSSRSRAIAGLLRLRTSEALRRSTCVCFEIWRDLLIRSIEEWRLRRRFQRQFVESELHWRAMLIICGCWRTWAAYVVRGHRLGEHVDNSVTIQGEPQRAHRSATGAWTKTKVTRQRLARVVSTVSALRVFYAWRLQCVQDQKAAALIHCDQLCSQLVRVQRVAHNEGSERPHGRSSACD